MIYVTSLEKLPLAVETLRPARVISLMPRENILEAVTLPEALRGERHLIVSINDITYPVSGYVHPDESHVEAIFSFVDDWWGARENGSEEGGIVVHCLAGVSRSSAAAFITLCRFSDPGDEEHIALEMRRRGPHFVPNALLVQIADDLMERGGKMVDAIEAMGAGDGFNDTDWVSLELWR